MTNPTEPGQYRVTFKALKDSGMLPEGMAWHYNAHLTFDGNNWLCNGEPADMTGAVKWEILKLDNVLI